MTISPLALAICATAGALAISLAGCATQERPAGATTSAITAAPPQAVAETGPGTGACGEQITRLRQVLRQDRDMGHVADGVYRGMVPHIERAAEKCRAGDQRGALLAIASVKKNNGYY